MSEMVERVAKAIYEADDVWSGAFPWPNMGSKEQSADEYRRIARAAIEAMREPTDAMEDHAFATVRADSDNMQCPEFYRAMIDAALKPL